ncbi:GpE family phage tail protein [Aggregatibacter actinomycetemcomitans]
MATIFHWAPSAYGGMTFSELMDWREKARERHEQQD